MKLIIIFLFLIYNFNLLSQSIELKKEYKLTNKYYKEKNYSEALQSNQKALNLSIEEFGKNHLTTATLFENKGRLLLELSKYGLAEIEFRNVVGIREKLITDYNPDMAEAYNYLALSL
jgi:tetratricopeptide (TPR) repeat protein